MDNNFEKLALIYFLIFITIFLLSLVLIRFKVRKLKKLNEDFRVSRDVFLKLTIAILLWPITIVILIAKAIMLLFAKLQYWLLVWVNDEKKSNGHGN